MPIALYKDVNIQRAIALELRRRGVDVITAQEDGKAKLADALLLDRATELGRVLFTYDHHFLIEAHRRQQEAIPFTGIIYARFIAMSIAVCARFGDYRSGIRTGGAIRSGTFSTPVG